MCLPSLTAQHLNLTTKHGNNFEFQMKTYLICRRRFRFWLSEFCLITLLFCRRKGAKFSKSRAELLFCPLDVLFCNVLVAIAVVVCLLRSLLSMSKLKNSINDRQNKKIKIFISLDKNILLKAKTIAVGGGRGIRKFFRGNIMVFRGTKREMSSAT